MKVPLHVLASALQGVSLQTFDMQQQINVTTTTMTQTPTNNMQLQLHHHEYTTKASASIWYLVGLVHVVVDLNGLRSQ